MRLFRNALSFVCLFIVLGQAAGAQGVKLQLEHKTRVPGFELKSGDYTIQLVDHLNDRMVIRIDDNKGKPAATFLAVPSSHTGVHQAGINIFPSRVKGLSTMRGFSFPDGAGVDFVYPKADAVAIAEANGSEVAAIDPASEGRVSASKLSKNDMELVTLWLLTPVRVGTDQKGIAAKRYESPTTNARTTPAEGGAASPTTQRQTGALSSSPRQPGARQMATATRPPVLAKLPHTASYLGLIYFLGGFSLLGALTMRLVAPKATEL